ncbi:hypothetical protein SUGI_0567490 [Cryptomeria japonica]|nr:hypothetical protein SUGI_0567490 [Cryptomeria japonica]
MEGKKEGCCPLIASVLGCLFLCAAQVSADDLNRLDKLSLGDSLIPQQNITCLVSPNQTFSAGFYEVGINAYLFTIWYTHTVDLTLVWAANQDQAVNGRDFHLHLQIDGNLLLSDANGSTVWETHTASNNLDAKQVLLLETGNLVMQDSSGQSVWESFENPTDTLLPHQLLRGNGQLVSSLCSGSTTSGYYHLYFDYDNILRLRFQSSYSASNYCPLLTCPLLTMEDRHTTSAVLQFWIPLIALPECTVHGLCGINGLCIYNPKATCTCPPGFHMKDPADRFKGCDRNVELADLGSSAVQLIYLSHKDFYGNDLIGYGTGVTFEECKRSCMNDNQCQGFSYVPDGKRRYYAKGQLLNGD